MNNNNIRQTGVIIKHIIEERPPPIYEPTRIGNS